VWGSRRTAFGHLLRVVPGAETTLSRVRRRRLL